MNRWTFMIDFNEEDHFESQLMNDVNQPPTILKGIMFFLVHLHGGSYHLNFINKNFVDIFFPTSRVEVPTWYLYFSS